MKEHCWILSGFFLHTGAQIKPSFGVKKYHPIKCHSETKIIIIEGFVWHQPCTMQILSTQSQFHTAEATHSADKRSANIILLTTRSSRWPQLVNKDGKCTSHVCLKPKALRKRHLDVQKSAWRYSEPIKTRSHGSASCSLATNFIHPKQSCKSGALLPTAATLIEKLNWKKSLL